MAVRWSPFIIATNAASFSRVIIPPCPWAGPARSLVLWSIETAEKMPEADGAYRLKPSTN